MTISSLAVGAKRHLCNLRDSSTLELPHGYPRRYTGSKILSSDSTWNVWRVASSSWLR